VILQAQSRLYFYFLSFLLLVGLKNYFLFSVSSEVKTQNKSDSDFRLGLLNYLHKSKVVPVKRVNC